MCGRWMGGWVNGCIYKSVDGWVDTRMLWMGRLMEQRIDGRLSWGVGWELEFLFGGMRWVLGFVLCCAFEEVGGGAEEMIGWMMEGRVEGMTKEMVWRRRGGEKVVEAMVQWRMVSGGEGVEEQSCSG